MLLATSQGTFPITGLPVIVSVTVWKGDEMDLVVTYVDLVSIRKKRSTGMCCL